MNKYQRKRSKRIKRIMRADRFGRISYRQARRMLESGVNTYMINGRMYRSNDYSELCRPMSATAMIAM